MGKKFNLSIKSKMGLSYATILLLIILTGVIGIRYVGQVYENGKDIYENDMKAVEYLKSISENVKELDKCTFHLLVELEWEHSESCGDQIDQLIEENISLMEEYSKLDISQEEYLLYEKGREQVLVFQEQINNLVSVKNELTEQELLKAYQDKMLPVQRETQSMIESAVELAIANADKANQTNKSIYNKVIIMMSSFILLAVVIIMGISFVMNNRIASKLQSIQRMAKRISEYNIADDIENIEKDEFGKTIEALNESQFMIRELLEKIIGESAKISDMGEEVYLAIKKSKQRVESLNVQFLEYEKLAKEVEAQVQVIVDRNPDNQEEKQALVIMRAKLEEAKEVREETRNELNSIATYLEQIGITADYQNEIANGHKEQVRKFKIKESEE